jgi:hypothetical protein
VVFVHDHRLNAILHREAEFIADGQVEAAVHDAEAVRRTDDGVGRPLEVVTEQHLDAGAVGELCLPLIDEWLGTVDENDLGRKPARVVSHRMSSKNINRTPHRTQAGLD